jgi:hypothetical protein
MEEMYDPGDDGHYEAEMRMRQDTMDAYECLGRVRAAVVEALPALSFSIKSINVTSTATASESMPGNVRMEVADMISKLQALDARITAALTEEDDIDTQISKIFPAQ